MSASPISQLGAKLRRFRERNSISQLQLENDIGLATGSLTKIESGKVQPNHQTLTRLIKGLDLLPYEAMMLNDFSLPFLTDLLNQVVALSLIDNEIELGQEVVNYIPKATRLLGASFNVVQETKLRNTAFTQSWYTEMLLNVLPIPYTEFTLDLERDCEQSLLVRSVVENQEYQSRLLSDFTSPSFSKNIAGLLQKTSNVRSLISIPMNINHTPLGAILYVQDNKDQFDENIPFLRLYTQVIAAFLYRLRFRYAT
jgi:transcriptional regulator with XRE-family HTH domain